jgi:hypothetical protein
MFSNLKVKRDQKFVSGLPEEPHSGYLKNKKFQDKFKKQGRSGAMVPDSVPAVGTNIFFMSYMGPIFTGFVVIKSNLPKITPNIFLYPSSLEKKKVQKTST